MLPRLSHDFQKMNLFLLHLHARRCARFHCDKHVVKMIVETAQILSTTHWRFGGTGPYKSTHVHHPTVLWVGESLVNYRWACNFGLELAREYTHRYGRIHATEKVLVWLRDHEPKGLGVPDSAEDAGFGVGSTLLPLCMPDEYRKRLSSTASETPCRDVVFAYRLFYVQDKARFCRWTKRSVPSWYVLGRAVLEQQPPGATASEVCRFFAQQHVVVDFRIDTRVSNQLERVLEKHLLDEIDEDAFREEEDAPEETISPPEKAIPPPKVSRVQTPRPEPSMKKKKVAALKTVPRKPPNATRPPLLPRRRKIQ